MSIFELRNPGAGIQNPEEIMSIAEYNEIGSSPES
jgi:hypothetical protein